jgi:Co/Zn/Cd efflux system component
VSHLRTADGTILCDHVEEHDAILDDRAPDSADHDEHDHNKHDPDDEHDHSHGLVDRSILRSREGLKAVAWSLGILGLAAVVQLLIFLLTHSVALLADLIHNFGDALTAVPLAIAFYLRSFRAEKIAGRFVVFAIFVSACVAL